MAVAGWILDKSAAARWHEPNIRRELDRVTGILSVCAIGQLEQLYSATSARAYDETKLDLVRDYYRPPEPPDLLDRALSLQSDLAHHHGLWHRVPIPDLLIAETALYNDFGIVHVDSDFERIAKVRPLVLHRLR